MEEKQPFCIALGQGFIITILNDEIAALQDYAMDAGDAFWCIMGTDAWLELQTKASKPAIVLRSYDKVYFTCFINNDIADKIAGLEESGIIVLSSNETLTPEQLLKDFDENSSLDDIGYWIENKNKKEGVIIEGLLVCYYSKETRKRLHGADYID